MKHEEETALALKRLHLARVLLDRRGRSPIDWYEPHAHGQMQFHKALHKYRLLFPGNGWGKTTAMGAEAHWWATHTHPYQLTPPWPILSVWFVKLRVQFELIRQQLAETVMGSMATWQNGHFRWPDGSKMYLGSADRGDDWMKWAGAPLDLAMFDEPPPRRLWEEMTMRRRAKRKTRFVVAATAVDGDSWMEEVLYLPWLRHHQAMGMDEARAMAAQAFPSSFVWAMGGIQDNPAADQGDIDHYNEATAQMHPNERKVRLTGGFASWTGDPVFHPEAIEWLEIQAGIMDREKGMGMLGVFEPHGAPRRAA